MKLQFKHQKFQADAAKAVVDVFAGQPYLTPSYMMDRGSGYHQKSITDEQDFTGWANQKIVPELSDQLILEHLQKIQRNNQITPSEQLEGRYNLTIEMETGVGKTYTYIKTMYELNKHYGWSKFIIVVPSIAIREGVYKSFQVTQEHFAEEYGKKVRFFIYNSAQLTEIDRFAKGLQSEIAESITDRPRAVTPELFMDKVVKDTAGNEQVIDRDTAYAINYDLIVNQYIDKKGNLTDKYYEDKSNGELKIAEEVADFAADIIRIIDSVYDSRAMLPLNARSSNIELAVDEDKLAMPEFKALWNKINKKSAYVVDFDTDELIQKAIVALDSKLRVSKIYFKVETGVMEEIESKETLAAGTAFLKSESDSYAATVAASSNVKYDLVGKLVDETGLTRKAVIAILKGIQSNVFNQFKDNPEEFIMKASELINDEKATAVIEHITYNVLDERYDTDIFTEPSIKGKLGVNAMKTNKHLYDHIIYDSSNEQTFATELDTSNDVAVYVKLPKGFYISTPVGHYNPDWAIAFCEGKVKHVYFVAETKGSMSSMQLRLIEESKIHCAREHFKAISSENIIYDVVDSYKSLMDKVMK